jgi:hypothetical protein
MDEVRVSDRDAEPAAARHTLILQLVPSVAVVETLVTKPVVVTWRLCTDDWARRHHRHCSQPAAQTDAPATARRRGHSLMTNQLRRRSRLDDHIDMDPTVFS